MIRRNFIKTSGLLSLTPLVPGFVNTLSASTKAETDQKILLVIEMSGGNDGINTLVPFADDEYRKVRPNLALKSDRLHKINDSLGLHRSMESAKELKVDAAQIQHVFDYKSRGVLEDLLLAQSKDYYKSDLKIRTTIAKVIRKFANEGNAVIVGRGGVAITRDIPKSLHVYLEAPLEWRALRVSDKHDFSIEQARNYAQNIDKKRTHFRDFFQGKGNDYTRFDIKLNCMTLEQDEIVDVVVGALKSRKMI